MVSINTMISMTTLLVLVILAISLEAANLSVISQQHQQHNYQQRQQAAKTAPIVQTTSGSLHGAQQVLHNVGNNQSVYKFLAIPYAEPPTGSLRFQRPVELARERSMATLDASKFGKTCVQFRHLARFISPLLSLDNKHQTSEDCLQLNVFVPASIGTVEESNGNKLEPSKQLPVLVWIPGEGFDFADARQFDGSYLAHKTHSIVVTVQYRVGVLGFLQAPELGITGNMGVYDQIMALRWIKKNIAAFGGDPERTTVMGRFSGSMTISAMITAPKQDLIKYGDDDQTLFNRVILLSGVAVDSWIIEANQEQRFQTLQKELVENGYCASAIANSTQCMQNVPVERLLALAGYGWRLVVDNEVIGQVGPIEAIKRNQYLPQIEAVLMGETGAEGTLCLYRHMLSTNNNNYAQMIDDNMLTTKDFLEIVRDDALTYFGHNGTRTTIAASPHSDAIQTALETFERDLQANSQLRLREKYLDACASFMVKAHSNRFKRNLIARNKLAERSVDEKPVEIFHYELKYKPTFSLAPDYIKTAAHGDDIPLIFGLVYSQPRDSINEADLLMTQKMMAYIGNFVHGNHPLLHQHPSIDSSLSDPARSANHQQSQLMNGENTTINMDEDQRELSLTPSAAGFGVRTWSSYDQIFPIELTKSDSNEIHRLDQHHHHQHLQHRPQQSYQSSIGKIYQVHANGTVDVVFDSGALGRDVRASATTAAAGQELKSEKSSLRVIVVETSRQQSSGDEGSATVRSGVPLIDIIQSHNSQPLGLESPADNQHQVQDTLVASNQMTRSQRLVELHRQQFLEDNSWSSNAQQYSTTHQQQPSVSFINESAFMTMLLFSACLLIFGLISFCVVLSLILFRCQLSNERRGTNKATSRSHVFPHTSPSSSSSSSCNICDDPRASMEAALTSPTNKCKQTDGFSNVFAKLRSHHNPLLSTTAGSRATAHNSTRSESQQQPQTAMNNLAGGDNDLAILPSQRQHRVDTNHD